MDERARRLWAGTEANAIGYGGVAAVARATGMAISTVRAHAVIGELLPHVGEEQDGQPARLAEPCRLARHAAMGRQ